MSRASSFSVLRWSVVENPAWNPRQNVGFFAKTSGDKTVSGSTDWNTFAADTLSVVDNPRPGMYIISQADRFKPGTATYQVLDPAIFLISGTVRIRATNQESLNGVYQVGLQVGDNQNVVSGLFAQTTQTSSTFVELTFAGTMFVSADQEVRVMVKGSGDSTYVINALSSFSMVKLQQDYKTPGFIMEDSQTISTTGTTVQLNKWTAENKLGLTLR